LPQQKSQESTREIQPTLKDKNLGRFSLNLECEVVMLASISTTKII